MLRCKYDRCSRTGTSVLNISRHEQHCFFREMAEPSSPARAMMTRPTVALEESVKENSVELALPEESTTPPPERSLIADLLELLDLFSR